MNRLFFYIFVGTFLVQSVDSTKANETLGMYFENCVVGQELPEKGSITRSQVVKLIGGLGKCGDQLVSRLDDILKGYVSRIDSHEEAIGSLIATIAELQGQLNSVNSTVALHEKELRGFESNLVTLQIRGTGVATKVFNICSYDGPCDHRAIEKKLNNPNQAALDATFTPIKMDGIPAGHKIVAVWYVPQAGTPNLADLGGFSNIKLQLSPNDPHAVGLNLQAVTGAGPIATIVVYALWTPS